MTNISSKQWFTERLSPYETHSHKLKKILVQKKTRFQHALVADSWSFGRCLILDGEMQSAQSDEFIYHESLVHSSMVLHPNPKRVAILGGGEGATLREILRHRNVESVQMVDIDGEVVQFCKKYMPAWHQGSFSDPRAELIIGDAKQFIEDGAHSFDIIFSDLPSPAEDTPVYQLYTVEFFRKLKKRLAPNGIFTLQAGSGSMIQMDLHTKLYHTLKQVFPIVRSYSAHVPSFDVPWSFLLCCSDRNMDPLKLTSVEVEKRLKKRVRSPIAFYDGATHTGLFNLPKHIRCALSREKGVIRMNSPAFLFK